MTPAKLGKLDIIIGIGVAISMLLAWFLFPPKTSGGINTTSVLGLRYFVTFFVGFLGLLVYGGVRSSPKMVGFATILVTIGCILLYLS